MGRGTSIALAIAALAIAGIGIASGLLFQGGFSARDHPSALEAFLARYLRRLAVPKKARDAKNPIQLTGETLSEAMAHFADHCSVCHANDGSGQTKMGQGLYPKAPDMRQPGTQSLSDGELFFIVRNGIRFTGMPGWGEGPAEKDEDSWKLVHFIRRLPKISPEEMQEMESMNPRSRQELEKEEERRDFLRGHHH